MFEWVLAHVLVQDLSWGQMLLSDLIQQLGKFINNFFQNGLVMDKFVPISIKASKLINDGIESIGHYPKNEL